MSFCCWVVRILCTFWILNPYDTWFVNISSHPVCCFFHILDNVLWCTRTFYLMKFNYFFLLLLVLWCQIYKYNAKSKVLKMYFFVFFYTFRSLIHFDLIFVYGMRQGFNFILLHVVILLSQLLTLFFKRLFFLHQIALAILSKINGP